MARADFEVGELQALFFESKVAIPSRGGLHCS